MASVTDAFEARVLELFSGKCILIRENDTPRKRIFDDGSCRILQGKLCMDFVAPVEYSEIVERNQLFCNVQFSAQGFANTHNALVFLACRICVHGNQRMFERYLRVEPFPMFLL